MNQEMFIVKKVLKYNRKISSIKGLLIIAITLLLLIYIPLFSLELDLRSDQIKDGVPKNSMLPVSGSDSFEYLTLADNLLKNHVFSIDNKSTEEGILKPDTFRTIGYPLFLSFFIPFVGVQFIPLLQIFLVFIAAYLIYQIARYFFNDRVGVYSFFLFLIDPVTILYSLIILTDVLYIFLIISTFYVFFCLKKNYMMVSASSAFILGLSTLVRPISMFLLIVFLSIYIIQSIKEAKGRNQIYRFCLIFVSVYFLTLSPWIIRNKIVSGVYGLSTVKSYNIYHYYIPEYLSFIKHIDPIEARRIVAGDLGNFDERSLSNARAMQKRSISFIKADPFGYGFFHLVKIGPFFLSSGVEASYDILNQAMLSDVYPTNKVNMTNLLLSFDVAGLIKAMSNNLAIFIEQIVLLLFWLLALFSIYVGYKNKLLPKILILWIFILYFAILTGPVSYSRYRLQSTPFLFMLVVYTITHEITHYYSKSRQK